MIDIKKSKKVLRSVYLSRKQDEVLTAAAVELQVTRASLIRYAVEYALNAGLLEVIAKVDALQQDKTDKKEKE